MPGAEPLQQNVEAINDEYIIPCPYCQKKIAGETQWETHLLMHKSNSASYYSKSASYLSNSLDKNKNNIEDVKEDEIPDNI